MTTKTELLRTIRNHCLKCCSNSWLDVKDCKGGPDAKPYSQCLLWQFRLGVDPKPSKSRVEAGKTKVKVLNTEKIEMTTTHQTSILSGQVT